MSPALTHTLLRFATDAHFSWRPREYVAGDAAGFALVMVATDDRSATCDMLLFTPDGTRLFACGDDKVVRRWIVEDNGFATCLRAENGEQVWRGRLGGRKYSASPVVANGKLYFTSEDGLVTVVKTGTEFEVIAKNEVGELVVASPALSQGRIFLRGKHTLYCLQAK